MRLIRNLMSILVFAVMLTFTMAVFAANSPPNTAPTEKAMVASTDTPSATVATRDTLRTVEASNKFTNNENANIGGVENKMPILTNRNAGEKPERKFYGGVLKLPDNCSARNDDWSPPEREMRGFVNQTLILRI